MGVYTNSCPVGVLHGILQRGKFRLLTGGRGKMAGCALLCRNPTRKLRHNRVTDRGAGILVKQNLLFPLMVSTLGYGNQSIQP